MGCGSSVDTVEVLADEIEYRLSKSPFFFSLTNDQLRLLSDSLTVMDFLADQLIYERDSDGDGFYIVCSGSVKLRSGINGDVDIVRNAGDFFGDLVLSQPRQDTTSIASSIVTGGANLHQHTAISATACQLYFCSNSAFDIFMTSQTSRTQQDIHQLLSRNIVHLVKKIPFLHVFEDASTLTMISSRFRYRMLNRNERLFTESITLIRLFS